jgi:hypothetical protein
METTYEILSHIGLYIKGLDWQYMLTFIIITIGINSYCLKKKNDARIKTRTRYRVALIGVLYGVTIYLLRSYTLKEAENLFQSFIFALVFHKLIIEAVLYWLVQKGLPESIAKHLLEEEKLEKLKSQQ